MNSATTPLEMSLRDHERKANRAAQSLMGAFGWPTVLLGVACVGGYAAALGLAMAGLWPLWLSFVVAAISAYAVYTVLHDAVHNSISGKRRDLQWINDLFGYAAGQILMIAYTAHKAEHLAHHRYTNIPGKDPDIAFAGGKSVVGVGVGALKAMPVQYIYYLRHRWGQAPAKEQTVFLAEVVIMIGWRVAIIAAGFWAEALVVFVGSSLLALLALVILFAWSVHYPHDGQGRYQDTIIMALPPWLERVGSLLWLNQNYHAVHHLFPLVPFYRYRALYTAIRPAMEANGAPVRQLGRAR